MSDRVKGLTIILDKNYREDDIEGLMKAIRYFKGVLKVVPEIATAQDFFIEQREKVLWQDKIMDLFLEKH